MLLLLLSLVIVVVVFLTKGSTRTYPRRRAETGFSLRRVTQPSLIANNEGGGGGQFWSSLSLSLSLVSLFSLPRQRTDIFKTSIAFSGAFLLNSQPLTVRSCPLKRELDRMDYIYIGWTVTTTKPARERAGFEWLPLQWLVIGDLVSAPIHFRAVLSDVLLP